MEEACLLFFEMGDGIEDTYTRKVIVWMRCVAMIQLMFTLNGIRG